MEENRGRWVGEMEGPLKHLDPGEIGGRRTRWFLGAIGRAGLREGRELSRLIESPVVGRIGKVR